MVYIHSHCERFFCIIPYFLAHYFLELVALGCGFGAPESSLQGMAPVWALVEQLGRMGVKARLPPAPCKKKKTSDWEEGHGLLHKGAVLEKVDRP